MKKYKINHMMLNFRDALISLVPVFDAIDVDWKHEEDQYEEFDEISETLFRNLVVRDLARAFESENLLQSLQYGFQPTNHNTDSYIGIRPKGDGLSIGRFLSFTTTNSPFDKITYIPTSNSDLKNACQVVPVEDFDFLFCHRNRQNQVQEIFEISVEL